MWQKTKQNHNRSYGRKEVTKTKKKAWIFEWKISQVKKRNTHFFCEGEMMFQNKAYLQGGDKGYPTVALFNRLLSIRLIINFDNLYDSENRSCFD